jgi:hypothetical protein
MTPFECRWCRKWGRCDSRRRCYYCRHVALACPPACPRTWAMGFPAVRSAPSLQHGDAALSNPAPRVSSYFGIPLADTSAFGPSRSPPYHQPVQPHLQPADPKLLPLRSILCSLAALRQNFSSTGSWHRPAHALAEGMRFTASAPLLPHETTGPPGAPCLGHHSHPATRSPPQCTTDSENAQHASSPA